MVRRSESGAVLILALVYIIVISVTVGALAYWATNDLNNTSAFFSGTQLQYAASSAAKTAIQSIRTTPEPYTPTSGSALADDTVLITGTNTAGNSFVPSDSSGPYGECWTPASGSGDSTVAIPITNNGGSSSISITVWCTTGENLQADTTSPTPKSNGTRVVSVYACLSSVPESQCVQTPLLYAQFSIDDYVGGGKLSNQCNLVNITCGAGGSTELSWIYTKADGS